MHLSKSFVVCLVAVVICGCDRSQPTPPATTNNPTPVELPDSTNSIGMQFKLVPAGSFTMGSESGEADETPHQVTLTQPFYLGVYEVTQEQYERVMGENPSKFKGPKNPVEHASWDDAVEFCRKLSALTEEKAAGRVYRLPTEAEWEYACRAGTTTKYSFGDSDSELGDYAWYVGNSDRRTHPVGQKKPNAWGLYDMHGNVFELVRTNPTGPSEGSIRVLVGGGGWNINAGHCLSGNRLRVNPGLRSNSIGFRVAQVPLPDNKRASEAESGRR